MKIYTVYVSFVTEFDIMFLVPKYNFHSEFLQFFS